MQNQNINYLQPRDIFRGAIIVYHCTLSYNKSVEQQNIFSGMPEMTPFQVLMFWIHK